MEKHQIPAFLNWEVALAYNSVRWLLVAEGRTSIPDLYAQSQINTITTSIEKIDIEIDGGKFTGLALNMKIRVTALKLLRLMQYFRAAEEELDLVSDDVFRAAQYFYDGYCDSFDKLRTMDTNPNVHASGPKRSYYHLAARPWRNRSEIFRLAFMDEIEYEMSDGGIAEE